MAEDINKRTEQYIQIRDAIARVKKKHTDELKPLLDIQEAVAGLIQAFMEANNITDGLKTSGGTCYLSTKYTASVADGEAFMAFVKQGNWDMIERRANPTAVKDYVKEHNHLPAGVNLTAFQQLGVRRPGKSKD